MSWNDGLDERRTSSEDTVLEMNVTCTAFVSCNSACILQGLPLRVVLARSMTILMKETAFNGMRDFTFYKFIQFRFRHRPFSPYRHAVQDNTCYQIYIVSNQPMHVILKARSHGYNNLVIDARCRQFARELASSSSDCSRAMRHLSI